MKKKEKRKSKKKRKTHVARRIMMVYDKQLRQSQVRNVMSFQIDSSSLLEKVSCTEAQGRSSFQF